MVATTLTRPAARAGSSAAALIPVGNPSAVPSPQSTTPTSAVANAGPNTTTSTPTKEHNAPARSTRTRPNRSSERGPNHRPMVIAATNTT